MGMTKRERNTNAETDTESCHYQYSFIRWIFKIQKSGLGIFLTLYIEVTLQCSVSFRTRRGNLKYAENNYKQESF